MRAGSDSCTAARGGCQGRAVYREGGGAFAASRSSPQSALPLLYAATSVDAAGGGYYGPKGFGGTSGLPGVTIAPEVARDGQVAATLWQELERLSGVSMA
jgi:hypothetical protein